MLFEEIKLKADILLLNLVVNLEKNKPRSHRLGLSWQNHTLTMDNVFQEVLENIS